MDVKIPEGQSGLLWLLGLLITGLTGLLGWRGHNATRNTNASADRQSRFEENLQKRLEDALKRIDELTTQRDVARDGRALLEQQLRAEKKAKRNLLELLAPDARQAVEKWVQESSFAPFDSGSGRRK